MKQTAKSGCAAVKGVILFLLVAAVSVLTAQVVSRSSVDVTVTDPYGRTVAGLQQSYFSVTEAGAPRTITAFSEVREQSPKEGVHYKLEFESASQGGRVEVVFNQPRGLPPLTVAWK
jgi:hypothetical protein